MSVTRYSPHIRQAFRVPAQNPAMLVRIAAPWLVLALVALFIKDAPFGGAALLSMALMAVAFGGFGFFWQRFVGGEQAVILSPVGKAIRLLLWIMAYQALQGLELFSALLLGILFEGQTNVDVLVKAGQQLFQILIGCFFLMLPHFALGTKEEVRGTRLQEMVLAGGIAVGLGYVLSYLPFLFLAEIARSGFASLEQTATVEQASGMVSFVIHFLSVMIATGYFALTWIDLRASAPRLGQQAAEAEAVDEAEPAKEKRTTRLNRANKARR
ncbi:MAG: hypothetical protein H7Z12_14880 [Rhodospirillaceae bacterium]|nr:hypothetical protein [Rhodospirillales bacterium]